MLLQSRWTKDQLAEVLQEMALQAGVKLSIGKIEGNLPLKWSFSNVQLILPEEETVNIDALQMRLAFLPLLRGQFGLSYLHADKVIITYTKRENGSTNSAKVSIKGSFFLALATIDQMTLINRQTQEEATYSLTGSGRWRKGGRSFFAEASIYSNDLDGTVFIEGNKKLNHFQTAIKFKTRSEKAFSPFYTLPLATPFEFHLQGEGPFTKGPIQGKIELSSSLVHLQGSAELGPNFWPTQGRAHLSLPDLSLFSSHLKGLASGEISLEDKQCLLSFATGNLTIDQTTFTDGELKIEAENGLNGWNGTITAITTHPTLGFRSSAKLHWTPHQSIGMTELDLTSPIGNLAGDLTYSEDLLGGLSFQITDLTPLSELTSLDLAGQIGGALHFEGKEWRCSSLGKHLKVDQFLSDRVDLDLSFFDFWKIGSVKIKGGPSYLDKVYFTLFSYEMGWNTVDWDYKIQALGDWKGSFDIGSQGKIGFSSDRLHLLCDQFDGKIMDKPVSLEKPFEAGLSKEKFNLDQLELNLDGGSFQLSTLLSPTQAHLKVNAEHFPLDFLTLFSSRFSLEGLSSLDVDLQGSQGNLRGHLNLLLQRADIYPTGSDKAIQTKGNLQMHLAENTLQLHTHLVATDQQLCDISATLPFHFALWPPSFELVKDRPIFGQLTVEGLSQQLFDFINIGSQRVGGFISTDLLLSGTLEDPILQGPISIQGGFYENYFIGIAVKDADVEAEAIGKEVIVRQATTTDGEKGTAKATAVFHLKKGLPFFSQGTVSHFRVLRFDWLTGACSGPFTIDGNLEKALAKATLELDEADVSIPDQLPSDLPTLPVTFINQKDEHSQKLSYSESYPFCYELDVHGDHDLRLSGRGIEAELGGTIHMTGKNLAVLASGALYTQKGKFSFAGKEFNITKGELRFSESSAFMNITSSVELSNLSVTIHFRGSLSNPQLIFESTPALPTSSIISHILFDKDVSALSTSEAIQLANTIVSLSGGSGTNVLESIRKIIGIDRLSFSASEEGKVSVQIGKYLTHGVTITLNQSTEQSHVKVEVELKGGFLLEAETQEDNQGKFSFKWNKNY